MRGYPAPAPAHDVPHDIPSTAIKEIPVTAFTPSRVPGNATTEADFLALIVNQELESLTALEALIPSDVTTSWAAFPEDHIKHGAKYEWREGTSRRMVRIHEPDLKAPESDSNATMGWIARIQVGNRHLAAKVAAEFVRNASSQANADATHIPIKRSVSNMGKVMESASEMHKVIRTTSKATVQDRLPDSMKT